jgi:putative ABC transport system ATP-binding protein
MTRAIDIQSVRKDYLKGDQPVPVLDGLDFGVEEGEFVALMGPSGSGKTTLLNLLGGLDRPTSGKVAVHGTDVGVLDDRQMAAWRSRNVGFIFQLYHLVPVLTAAENVELPLLLTKLSKDERAKRVKTALDLVGLGDRTDHYPRQLSGGQEQRVAIARAVVTDPRIFLADEPTGDLDAHASEEILGLLSDLNKELKKTIVMVTHDPRAAARASRTVHLEKGRLVDEPRVEPYRAPA